MNISHDKSEQDTHDFDRIRISIASPEEIRKWSFGEVTKPETINYRTFKPERDGLFCAKIFGPIKDYECLCGKYKKIKYKGVICDKCGVEVTLAKVRRERMGHIELAAPVVHVWFLRSLPSKISILLDIAMKDLERIMVYELHVVTDPGLTTLQNLSLISESELNSMQDEYGDNAFSTISGTEAIQFLLKELDLVQLARCLRESIDSSPSDTKKKKALKRLKLVEDFIKSGNKPEWMVMTVLPVLPPELRPLVPLNGGRYVASDLNDLYRRAINRNNRLRRFKELKAPQIVIRNEKRMLQEVVDALFDNGRRGRVFKNNGKKPIKSLSDMLKGKQGRFRQNLLGKRVDYSGRSVIVVGPELKLHQCGLPKKMALELFKPFVYSKLELKGIAPNLRYAKRMVEMEKAEVWDVLEEVIKQHPILLNRAPTLHRLGIQAFEPLLIEGKAIQLHPLVCAAFNADFDGDQMAVHVPLSLEAQIEARVLMMSTNNILSPANGKPIIVPDKDIVLGIYDLSRIVKDAIGTGMMFGSMYEIEYALFNQYVTLHSKISYRMRSADGSTRIIETTPGRLMIFQLLPQHENITIDLVNKLLTKKDITKVVDTVYRYCKQKETALFADRLMSFGMRHATRAAVSFGIDDMVIPETKTKHITQTLGEVKEFEQQYNDGIITQGERYNKIIDAWSSCGEKVAADMMQSIAKGSDSSQINSIYMMAHSGARGSATQIKQLSGMRGLMTKPSGEIIETPIISNLKEGLTVLEYFNSTHGARKGLADTALKTANSGYLTRRLVDVAQDYGIVEYDCGTTKSIDMRAVIDSGEIVVSLSERALGRVLAKDVLCPQTQEVLIQKNELLDEHQARIIDQHGIHVVSVRSVLTCRVIGGTCAKCYGRDLASGKLVSVGEAVGVIAAQSIGEPGTQLTLRTFHIGGAATKGTESSFIEANYPGRVKVSNLNIAKDSHGHMIVMSRSCEVMILDDKDLENARYKLPYGAKIHVQDGQSIERGQSIADWDSYNIPVIAEVSGRIVFSDMIDGTTAKDIVDDSTGLTSRVITESKQYLRGIELKPSIHLIDENGNVLHLPNGLEARYELHSGTVLLLEEGAVVNAGDVMARIPRESAKTKDITGGLPRVADLFEARKPKDHSIIASVAGRIEFHKSYKTKRCIFLHPLDGGDPVEYMVPKGRNILVQDRDILQKGDVIIDGSPAPQDILATMGVIALAEHITQEVQAVYRLQGVRIDDKHIEVVITQMLRKVEVVDPGNTNLAPGDVLDKIELAQINDAVMASGKKPAVGKEVLQGITRASLNTQSFISAASFQETTKVLTEAAIAGKIDYLEGVKENVICGRFIPIGTGASLNKYKQEARKLDALAEANHSRHSAWSL
ncbi:DNA-directed RNA polymerase subunit beta' [Candidatus Sarmatiella mevalonica]|uniref:DNA-directed RNA polymerase subunit beta' n=1 Tax=Candidatus Sarmatiella mevalonica TaxID=2770581 RepID=UPI001923F2F7|nr:DNA-directed RNA polymerase subunit beta' [Candidatus Sarmatiella mevalonica]